MSDIEKDKIRLDWLQRNTYAFVVNHETGKGFMRFSREYRDQEQDLGEYDVRKAIDEAIERSK